MNFIINESCYTKKERLNVYLTFRILILFRNLNEAEKQKKRGKTLNFLTSNVEGVAYLRYSIFFKLNKIKGNLIF